MCTPLKLIDDKIAPPEQILPAGVFLNNLEFTESGNKSQRFLRENDNAALIGVSEALRRIGEKLALH